VELAHSRSRITHTIGRLEKAQLVERQPCEADGRGIEAVMTAKGFAALEVAAHTHVTGVHNYLVASTTPEQLAAIGDVFDKVAARLGGTRF
ncbi:MAG: MarR family transcriptional regulator, partial [Nocardioidaceae bacterium]|nr:MarR family transcriptional regulator [Nocardioidaceae bacterium]